jgi:hypothetical protein
VCDEGMYDTVVQRGVGFCSTVYRLQFTRASLGGPAREALYTAGWSWSWLSWSIGSNDHSQSSQDMGRP